LRTGNPISGAGETPDRRSHHQHETHGRIALHQMIERHRATATLSGQRRQRGPTSYGPIVGVQNPLNVKLPNAIKV
jgi:hypothetical protein